MYEELISRLKNLATLEVKNGESVLHVTAEATAAIREIAQEAADAIENTSKAYQMMAEAYEAEVAKQGWISVTERLPEDGQIVLCYWYNIHCATRDNYTAMRFRKGRTAEQLVSVKSYNSSDQWGNNLRPYCWDDPHGPLSLFGQDVSHWMPLPEPPKMDESEGEE